MVKLPIARMLHILRASSQLDFRFLAFVWRLHDVTISVTFAILTTVPGNEKVNGKGDCIGNARITVINITSYNLVMTIIFP